MVTAICKCGEAVSGAQLGGMLYAEVSAHMKSKRMRSYLCMLLSNLCKERQKRGKKKQELRADNQEGCSWERHV